MIGLYSIAWHYLLFDLKNVRIINSLHATGFCLYPLKISENQRIFDVLRGYRQRLVAWNNLSALQKKSHSSKNFSIKHFAFLLKKHLSVDVTFLEDIFLRTAAWDSLWNIKINLVYVLTANFKSLGFFPEFPCF